MTQKEKALKRAEELKDYFDTMGKTYFSNELKEIINDIKSIEDE